MPVFTAQHIDFMLLGLVMVDFAKLSLVLVK